MKQDILPAIRLTLVSLILVSVLYPLFIWGFAQFIGPAQGKAELVYHNGQAVGAALVGQSFSEDRYFWGRPSAVDYNGAGSAGSNKGPSNPDYLALVQTRIDSFLVHNPSVAQKDIPAELVTASGSGLDPDISPAAAKIQIARISAARGIPAQQLERLIEQHNQQALLGLFGPEKVNVLTLNLALDQIK
jgi:potassium-transporting ATPase KdpC subunit